MCIRRDYCISLFYCAKNCSFWNQQSFKTYSKPRKPASSRNPKTSCPRESASIPNAREKEKFQSPLWHHERYFSYRSHTLGKSASQSYTVRRTRPSSMKARTLWVRWMWPVQRWAKTASQWTCTLTYIQDLEGMDVIFLILVVANSFPSILPNSLNCRLNGGKQEPYLQSEDFVLSLPW